MSELIALGGLVLGVLLGWWARGEWSALKIRRYFNRIREEQALRERLEEQPNSIGNGWSHDKK